LTVDSIKKIPVSNPTPVVTIKKVKEAPSNQVISLFSLQPGPVSKEKKFKEAIHSVDQKPKPQPKAKGVNKKRPRAHKDTELDEAIVVKSQKVTLNDADFTAPKEFLEKQRLERPSPDQIIQRQKPTTLNDVIGQDKAISKMRQWFQQFNECFRHVPRCLMLVGPSGVGKTLCAELLMREFGFAPITYSLDQQFHVDTTSKEPVCPFSEKGITDVVYKTLLRHNDGPDKSGIILDSLCGLTQKALKLMAEVVSGERKAKIANVKRSSVWMAPLIITVDASEMSSLTKISRHCQVVEMPRVAFEHALPFFQNICAKEDISLPQTLIKDVVEGCGGDVRRLLNTLHFFALKSFSDQLNDNGTEGVIDISTIFYDEANSFNVVKHFLKRLLPPSSSSATERKMEQNIQQNKESVETMMLTHKTSLAFLLQSNHISLTHQLYEQNTKVQNETVPNETVQNEQNEDWLQRCINTAELVSDNDLLYHQVYDARNILLLDTCTTCMNWGVGVSTLFPLFQSPEQTEKVIDTFSFSKTGLYACENGASRKRELMSSFQEISDRGTDMLELFELVSSMVKRYARPKTKESDDLDRQLLKWIEEKNISYKDLQNIWKLVQMDSEMDETTMPNPRGNRSLKKYITDYQERAPSVMKEVKKKKK
jgi:DNA polymerase III delta prime subunit